MCLGYMTNMTDISRTNKIQILTGLHYFNSQFLTQSIKKSKQFLFHPKLAKVFVFCFCHVKALLSHCDGAEQVIHSLGDCGKLSSFVLHVKKPVVRP